ncbi:ero-1 [Pristionchus pacificus]|nr:ero-1 [Pristionchus pacificus]
MMILSGWVVFLFLPLVNSQFEDGHACFRKIGESVEASSCLHSSIDSFNAKFYPVLHKLLKRDFFRYFKVNMDKSCPFWSDDRECASRECGIENCDDKVPSGLRQHLYRIRQNETRPLLSTPNQGEDKCEEKKSLSTADRSLTGEEEAQLRRIDDYDLQEELKFCEVDDEDSSEAHYVDLSKNPEKYTGYAGDSAVRVWKSIYQENCFKPDMRFDKDFLINPNDGLCYEKRVFYRLISGFHSAITISIASYNYKPPAVAGFGSEGSWFRNVEMFKGRFGTKWSWEGPQRLKNVYFVFLLELRALVKASQYLKEEMFFTGNDEEDVKTRGMMKELIEMAASMPNPFNESEMFTGIEANARELREEFRGKFLNISRIMDCVGCDKCRLWGKVQVQGMGTALKILFADALVKNQEIPFQLSRTEVVALLQSIGRFSSSINEVDLFRSEMGIEPVSSFIHKIEDIPERKKRIDL